MDIKIGDLIDRLEANRNKRRIIEKELKPLEEEYKDIKLQILEKLDAEHSTKAGGKMATVSISEVEVPVIDDVEAMVKYVSRNKLWHLFLAQPLTTPAWREAKGLKGKDLPGTHTFIKRDINHSSLKGA